MSKLAPFLALALAAAGCASAAPPADDAAKIARIAELVASYRPKFPDVPEVDVAGFRALAEAGPVVLVDVRTPAEQAVSMIPGAVSQEAFEAAEGRYAGETVVAYCTIGYRSGEYAEKLRREGWDARNLEGSVLSWTHAGGDLVGPDGQPTRRVHVYGRTWDLAASGYEATW